MSDCNSTSFLTLQAARRDYGSQFEILVAVLYNQIVKPGDIVVDGGANAGLHAYALARKVGPGGLLVAFEPNPEVFESLSSNVAQLSVELHRLALSDRQAMLPFVIDEANPALSHIHHAFDASDPGTRTILVKSVTLDRIVGARRIAFIKLDLEGADFLAIRGGVATLRRDRPPIVFENSRAWASKCHAYTAEEFFRFFAEIDYAIYDLHGRELTREIWDFDDIAFEFIGLPKEAGARNRHLLDVIAFFWSEVESRPVLPEWTDCVIAVRDAPDYMTSHHGEAWLSLLRSAV
ncbi:FkbM family methyltransferase [uncultured Rhodoblastus sp.]|uniref:FkbM family methyltransferase n=1 Tax=uncultured Rhodoblastus sp. TaxID=543037 RepID=UPI0025E500D1|nr:FkbM family methyltransferase [uncultured Rhodoblastus sp.]